MLRDVVKPWIPDWALAQRRKWLRLPEPSAERLELARLRALPRYEPTSTNLLGHRIDLPDAASFLEMHDEVFVREMFAFPCDHNSPRIIDGGANIGLVALYYKQRFPQARIVAFEPDPAIFATLAGNLRHAGIADVELQPLALAGQEKEFRFMVEGSYAGRIAHRGDPTHVSVRAVRLRPWLSQPVDLLKLNIEGAETEVLRDCSDLLGNVRCAIVEYHSFADERQALPDLLRVLNDAGFRVHINPVRAPLRQPLIEREVVLGFDLQLAIFAYRP